MISRSPDLLEHLQESFNTEGLMNTWCLGEEVFIQEQNSKLSLEKQKIISVCLIINWGLSSMSFHNF